LDEYMNVFRQRTLTERERIMASKSIAKAVGLFSFADFTSSLGIRRVEPEPPAEEAMPPLAPAGDGGDDDGDGGGDGGYDFAAAAREGPLGERPALSLPSTQPEEGEAPPAPSARSAPAPTAAAAAASAPPEDYWIVEKKGKTFRIPTKESVLMRMSKPELLELARNVKRGNKMIYESSTPMTLRNYIRQRVVGDFSSLGVSIFDDVD